jgi:uncharacterized repeat protein (TIGR01451 family)
MEEVRRVTTTRKPKRRTVILLTLVGILGLGLIGAAIYFYAIGDTSDSTTTSETTCACYYIDPSVISECGDPRRGFMFETATVTGDQVCRASCATNKLSVNLLNSNTKQDLYQICQIQSVQDKRCSNMTIKDKEGKIVTGRINSDDEITVEAEFDQEYSGHKFVINNQDTDPDVISPDKLNIKKDIKDLSGSTISIVATALDSNNNQINSPLCRRLIEVEQAGTSAVSDIQIQVRKDENTYKVSRVRIGVGNIKDDTNVTIRFSFEKNLTDLLMNEGFTIDSSKGEITILEQDLYNPENFGTDKSFSQLDGLEGNIKINAEIRDETGVIGSVAGSFDFPRADSSSEEDPIDPEESNFEVSKSSNLDCVERVAPDNIAQFTITATNKSSITQKVNSIKDKLPLGFTYVNSSSKINGISVADADYVTVTNVGDTQEIVWEKSGGWDINAGQSFVIIFQSQVGANALTGSNQNEVIMTPQEVPADPTSLRAEFVIQVAQDCQDPDATTPETPTTPTTPQTPTTPSTGIFDSVIGRLIAGLITILIGWYIYSRPLGQIAIQKLVESGLYKEAEIATWRVFRPRKYFEAKILKKLKNRKKI